MESIKFQTKYIDTSGVYDSNEGETQNKINSDLQFVDNLDIRTPLMYLCDDGYYSVQGLCCVQGQYIIVGRYTGAGGTKRDLMVFDIVNRKVIKSNIFFSDSAETGKNVDLGHLSSITYVREGNKDYLYIPRSKPEELTDEKGNILRLTFNATTGDISLDGEFMYVAPVDLQHGDKTVPYMPLCLAYAGGGFYYIASTTKSNRCYIYKISDDFSTTELAFTTTFDGLSAGHFARQGFTSDNKYLYFSLSSRFNVSREGTDHQYLMRSTQEIIITDLNGTVVKSLSFPRGEYGEIEDIDLITPDGSTTPSIVIACNRNDGNSNFAPVYACPLYRNSKKSFYLLTQDSEGSLLRDSERYNVYCDSSPCYIDTSGNATTTYNVLNSNPFATGLIQDKFTSIPAAIGYIKKLGIPVTLYISGKHGNMEYRGLRGINFVFDGNNTDGTVVNTEVGDITINDSYGISLSFVNGATHGTINTENTILFYEESQLAFELTGNSYWNLENDTAALTPTSSWSVVGSQNGISVTEGEEYSITACQGNTAKTRIWAVTDDNLNILETAPDFQNSNNEKFTSICKIPAGGTKLLITGRTHSSVAAPAISISKRKARVITEFGDPINVEFTSGGLNNSYSSTTSNTRIRVIGRTLPMLPAGSIIRVKEPYTARIIASKSAIYSTYAKYMTDWLSGDYIVPSEDNGYYFGALIRKTGHEDEDISADVDILSDYIQFIPKLSSYELARRKLLSGKKLSVMGDSMSAMAGYIPSDFPSSAAYYKNPKDNPDKQREIFSADQMWWGVLCKLTGMTPLVINAYSGSGVSHLEETDHSSITEMSHDSRCAGLGTMDDEPDVIIIAGGTNDYSYAMSAQSEPLPWDGKTAPTIGDSFTEAYACMIKKIRDNYPNAIIVCLSTWFTVRGEFNGYTYTHTSDNTNNVYTQADYDAAIENVCKQMRVPYINVNNVGFNAAVHYGQYASDKETMPTHLNARGHYVIGKCIAEKIIPLVIGLKNNDYFKYTTS